MSRCRREAMVPERLGGKGADLPAKRHDAALAIGMQAVTEEYHKGSRARIDPGRCAGKAGMSEGADGEMAAARAAVNGVNIPAKRAARGPALGRGAGRGWSLGGCERAGLAGDRAAGGLREGRRSRDAAAAAVREQCGRGRSAARANGAPGAGIEVGGWFKDFIDSTRGLASSAERAAALEAYGKALAIREQVFGPQSERVGHTCYNMARAYKAQGEREQARAFYERAAAAYAAALGPGHESTVRARQRAT